MTMHKDTAARAQAIANALAGPSSDASDAYWTQGARIFLRGLVLHVLMQEDNSESRHERQANPRAAEGDETDQVT
jgi:hypothetical protein